MEARPCAEFGNYTSINHGNRQVGPHGSTATWTLTDVKHTSGQQRLGLEPDLVLIAVVRPRLSYPPCGEYVFHACDP